MKFKLSILFSLIASCCLGANVTFTQTNLYTQPPSPATNSIFLRTPTGVRADGSLVFGSPFGITINMAVTPGFYEFTNMPPGLWLAQGKFINNNLFGPGLPAAPGNDGGILFAVDNTTNTYPFTTMSRSWSNGGINIFNFANNSGIAIIGTNGIVATRGPGGVYTLDGSAVTPTLTAAAVTNAIGYPVASNSFLILSIVPTNGPTLISFPVLFLNADTNGAGLYQSLVVGNNISNTVTQYGNSITNDINANAATAAAATALVQGNLTSTGNNLTNVSSAVLTYSIGVSNTDYGRAFNISNTAAANLASSGTSITNLAFAYSQSATNQANKAAHDATNVFLGWLGSLAFLNGINSNNVSGQINPSQIYPPISGGGAASSNTFSGQLNSGQIFPAVDSAGAAQASTNGIGIPSGLSAFAPTNRFDIAGAGTTAANQATNPLAQSAYEPTNTFDLAGAGTSAAGAATNKLAQSAYEPTNAFDLAGAGTSAAGQATNKLAQSAYEPTNAFDLNGAASSAASQATNVMGLASGTAAFSNTNQFDPAGSANGSWKTNNAAAFPGVIAPNESFTNNILNAQTIYGNTINGGTYLGNINLLGFKLQDAIAGLGGQGQILGNFGTGQAMWTNYFAGTANNSSNFMGYPTNAFDSAGAGTTAANKATNLLQQSAYEPTNTFDLNGAAVSAATIATNQVAPTNAPTIWNAIHKGITSFGGNPWSTETNGVLGLTNWASVNGFVNATFHQASSTLWNCTSNSWLTISTNGASCLLRSNLITIATSTTLVGPWTMQAPGTGTPGGSYIGSDWNGIGVYQDVISAGTVTGTNGSFTTINATNINLNGNLSASTFSGQFIGQSTNALTLSNFGHVLVLTNGYSGITNWIPDTVNPLQDALNYYTNFVGQTVATIQSGEGYVAAIANSNAISPTFEINGVFYIPSGLMVPSKYLYSSSGLFGSGPLTSVIIGDSNVLSAQTNILGGPDNAAASQFFCHDICFVYSNYQAKAVAVNAAGIAAYTEIYRNVIIPYSAYASTNFYYAFGDGGTGDSSWNAAIPPGPCGIIDILVDGSFGQQSVHDNRMSGADGIVSEKSHARIFNNEFESIGQNRGNGGSISTNIYVSTDTASYFGFPELQGFVLAIGGDIVIAGGDDVSCIGDKALGGNAGAVIVGAGGSPFGGIYGPIILDNEHDEALLKDLVFTTSSGYAAKVRMHDCFAQGAGDRAWTVYLQTLPSYAEVVDSNSDTNHAIDDSFSQTTGQVEWKDDNTQFNPMFYFSTNFFGTMVNGGTLRYTNKPPYSYAAPN